MQGIIDLAAHMQWPFAFMAIGVAAAAGVSIMSVRIARFNHANTRLQADRDVEIKKLEVSVKNGAVALTKRPEYEQ